MSDLSYPIGKFQAPAQITESDRNTAIQQIAALPSQLRSALAGLSDQQLDTPYRPGGWTVRQVVHHLADSHLNSYVRFRLAVTEKEPTIKPYDEKSWAELSDAKSAPVEVSLKLLESLHDRWVILLLSFNADAWTRQFKHPEYDTPIRLDRNLLLYAWHCRHHLTHITNLTERMGWRSRPATVN